MGVDTPPTHSNCSINNSFIALHQRFHSTDENKVELQMTTIITSWIDIAVACRRHHRRHRGPRRRIIV
jgi:hypothetical protein